MGVFWAAEFVITYDFKLGKFLKLFRKRLVKFSFFNSIIFMSGRAYLHNHVRPHLTSLVIVYKRTIGKM